MEEILTAALFSYTVTELIHIFGGVILTNKAVAYLKDISERVNILGNVK